MSGSDSKTGAYSLLQILPVLLLASAASIMATDLYAPSLPDLPEILRTTPAWVKLTVSVNVLALGLMQLVHGPLSDRYGRRLPMLIGMLIFSLASVGCALATTIEQLIALRIIQGGAAAVETVVGIAIIREAFSAEDQVRAFALFGIAIALVPAAAPILGGYIHIYLGWRANFWLMAGVGILSVLLVAWRLPETAPPHPESINTREVLAEYLSLFANRQFLGFTLLESMALAAIFAYITVAPFILIERFGIPTQLFGYFQMVIVGAYGIGSIWAERMARRLAPMQILRIGLSIFAAGVVVLLLIVAAGLETPTTLTAAMVLILFGAGPLFATCPVLALGAVTGRGGIAAAFLGGMELGVAGVASALTGILPWKGAVVLAIIMSALAIGGAFAYRYANINHTVFNRG